MRGTKVLLPLTISWAQLCMSSDTFWHTRGHWDVQEPHSGLLVSLHRGSARLLWRPATLTGLAGLLPGPVFLSPTHTGYRNYTSQRPLQLVAASGDAMIREAGGRRKKGRSLGAPLVLAWPYWTRFLHDPRSYWIVASLLFPTQPAHPDVVKVPGAGPWLPSSGGASSSASALCLCYRGGLRTTEKPRKCGGRQPFGHAHSPPTEQPRGQSTTGLVDCPMVSVTQACQSKSHTLLLAIATDLGLGK